MNQQYHTVSNRHRIAGPAAMLALLMLSPFLAWGHGVELFATVEGHQIHGVLRYADHTPVDGAAVHAYAPDGTIIAESSTGPDGRFILPVTRHTDYRLVGDAGEGHLGEYTIPASELPHPPADAGSTDPGEVVPSGAPLEPGGAPGPIDQDAMEDRIEQAMARQLAPLREQLFGYERTTRIRDIVGGIGYVFGLAGIVVLLKHRKTSVS